LGARPNCNTRRKIAVDCSAWSVTIRGNRDIVILR
jgi:hypothetical protein